MMSRAEVGVIAPTVKGVNDGLENNKKSFWL